VNTQESQSKQAKPEVSGTAPNTISMRPGCVRLFIAGFIAVFVLMALGTVVLATVSMAHPIRFRLVLISLTFVIGPGLLFVLLRKSRVRGLLSRKGVAKPLSLAAVLRQAPLVIVMFPSLVAGLSWIGLLLLLFSERGQDKQEWIKNNGLSVSVVSFLPQVVLAWLFAALHSPRSALYLAVCIIVTSVSNTMGGLRVENGVIAFFDKFQAQASPWVTLNTALIVAASFGIIHYALWTLHPSEYANLKGFQDALYFSVVTMATVGYGDVLPVGYVAKWVCVAEIVCGFLLLVVGVSTSMTLWIQKHQPNAETETQPPNNVTPAIGSSAVER
jgi:hypothetical protein